MLAKMQRNWGITHCWWKQTKKQTLGEDACWFLVKLNTQLLHNLAHPMREMESDSHKTPLYRSSQQP